MNLKLNLVSQPLSHSLSLSLSFSLSLSLSLSLFLIHIHINIIKYLAANYCTLVEDLSKAQNDRSDLERKLREGEDRYQFLQDKLAVQKKEFDGQVAAVVSEREGALEQAIQLTSSIQELEQKVQRLEAQKDQLEEDRFTARTALQELQSQHEQVTGSKTAGFRFEIGGSKRGH